MPQWVLPLGLFVLQCALLYGTYVPSWRSEWGYLDREHTSVLLPAGALDSS